LQQQPQSQNQAQQGEQKISCYAQCLFQMLDARLGISINVCKNSMVQAPLIHSAQQINILK
jgi:hypothetical protein